MSLTQQQHQQIYLELDKEVQKLRRQWVKVDNQAIAIGYDRAGTAEAELLVAKAAMLCAAFKAARNAANEYFANYL